VFECDLRTRLQNKSILFSISGGFFNAHLPVWMQWAKYLSIVHYPYACLNILSTRDLPVLWYVYLWHNNGEIQWKSAYMLEKPEGAINDVQSIYTQNNGYKTQNDHILKKNTT